VVTATDQRKVVAHGKSYDLSERYVCRLLNYARSTMRYQSQRTERDGIFTAQVKAKALEYPRFGYRRIAVMLSEPGKPVNAKRVYRIWQQANLALPKRRKRRRLGKRHTAPANIVAKQPNQVWSYDIVHDRLANGRMVYCLCIVDEYTRECLSITVSPHMRAKTVIEALEKLIDQYGTPRYIRSDNGAQFTARAVMVWLGRFYIQTAFIEPGKPWQNGYVESFHARLRDECLNMHIFTTGKHAQVLIEQWRCYYNEQRPHSSLNYQTPASQRKKINNENRQSTTLKVA